MRNKKTFIIQVSELPTHEEARKTIAALVSEYKTEINFDETTGTIKIDGSTNMPYEKEYWFPQPCGKPDLEIDWDMAHINTYDITGEINFNNVKVNINNKI